MKLITAIQQQYAKLFIVHKKKAKQSSFKIPHLTITGKVAMKKQFCMILNGPFKFSINS